MYFWDLCSLVWPLSLILTSSFNKILSYCHLKICLSILFWPDSLLICLSVIQRSRKPVELKLLGDHGKTFSVKFNILVHIFQIKHLQACIEISTH